MVEINSPKDLENWLSGRPPEWARVLAIRAALRVLPMLFSDLDRLETSQSSLLTLVVFRANAISVVASKFPTTEIAAADAARAAADAALAARAAGLAGSAAADAARAALAALAADAAARAAARAAADAARAAADDAADDAADAADAAARAAADAALAADDAANSVSQFWEQLRSDGNLLEEKGADAVLNSPLWDRDVANPLSYELESMREHLPIMGDGFGLWADWYDRRLAGATNMFALPAAADKEMARRLVERDDDWWNRPPAEVNADIQGWLDELRPTGIQPDPQQKTAPQFTTLPDGKITIDLTAGQDEVVKDAAAAARHQGLRDALKQTENRFRGHNNAGHFSTISEQLLNAIGDRIDDIEPSMTVLHAETFRQAVEIQQSSGPMDDLQPLSGLALLDVQAVISAINLFIGSDPFLDNMDRVRAGPDHREPLADPVMAKALAEAIAQDGIADDLAVNVIKEAASHAPSPPQADSRQTGQLTGTVLNLARIGIGIILTYPRAALTAAAGACLAGTIMVNPLIALGPGLLGALALAKNILANEKWWREAASMSEKTSANFEVLMDLLKNLPLKSSKDE